MNFLQKIEAVWQNVSIVQRALLIAMVLAVVGVAVSLVCWAGRPDMGVLYSSLDTEEAAKITEKISEKNIIYKLGNGGRTIYVPKKNVTQLRLDMAKDGLPESGQKGYGIFDDEKIGISPFVQNVNLKRALQDELARSIQMMDGVAHVRIHIVSPQQTLFASETAQTSASVVVQLKPGYTLSGTNIAAITHLVAGGVKGLKPEKVTIVDSQGRLLSYESDEAMTGGAGTVADYRERVEQNLADKVESMLTAVLGPGRATVEVSADIDMTNISTVTESYDPKGKVATKEEENTKKETEASTSSSQGKPGNKQDSKILVEYAVGKTVKQEVILPGQIKSLTVAAFVDLYPADPNVKELIMSEADIKDIIKNALGLKDAGSIKVVNARFSRPMKLLTGEEDSGGFDFVAIAGQASFGIAAICMLFVLKMFSGAKKKAALASPEGQLPSGEALGGVLTGGTDASETLALRRQIADSLRSNPEQAKRLFSSWLEEKRT